MTGCKSALQAQPVPKVSIIVSVYNDERWICRAIDSALEQTLAEVEVVVVDDGSTDATPLLSAGLWIFMVQSSLFKPGILHLFEFFCQIFQQGFRLVIF